MAALPCLPVFPQDRARNLATDTAVWYHQQLTVSIAPVLLMAAMVQHSPRYQEVSSLFAALAPTLLRQVGRCGGRPGETPVGGAVWGQAREDSCGWGDVRPYLQRWRPRSDMGGALGGRARGVSVGSGQGRLLRCGAEPGAQGRLLFARQCRGQGKTVGDL